MCTATWLRTDDGYEVLFNRDELRTRKPALLPRIFERDGVRIVAPIDGDAGGTWLGANEQGVTVGVANGAAVSSTGTFRSRGLLVLDLLASRDLADVERRLQAQSGTPYRPFSLFAIDGAGEMAVFGERQAVAHDECALLFSSSRDPVRARLERERVLGRMRKEHGGLDADLLRAFHASHDPERGAFSPCMHREEASTVSFSHVRVGAREIVLDYRPGPLCEAAKVATVRIPRGLQDQASSRG
jgi:hypothetical protein